MEMSKEAKRMRNEYYKKYRLANAEKIRQYGKEWRKNNPEKVKANTVRYWERKAKQVGDETKDEK